MIAIDEIQDIITDDISIIMESQLRSLNKVTLKSGTPKTTRNSIEYFWKQTKQNEWVVKCTACNNYNILGEENIGINGLVCAKCKKPITSANGRWASMAPGNYAEGFRISALMYAGQPDFIPWNGPPGSKEREDSLIKKYETYSKGKFYNEVLGIPYDSGTVPITEAEIIQACDVNERKKHGIEPGMHSGHTASMRDKLITAGVDWGTCQDGASATVLSIVTYIQDKFYLLYSKKYTAAESEPKVQIADILKTINHFGCMSIGCDWGFGYMQNRELAASFGAQYRGTKSNRVIEFFNSDGLGERRRWDDKSLKFIVSRNEIITDLFTCIKRKRIIFPSYDVFKPFAQDLLNVFQEFNERTNKMRYDHQPGEPDDFMFSLAYAIESTLIHLGKPSI